MTYIVLGETLNSTHSLTHSLTDQRVPDFTLLLTTNVYGLKHV